MALYDDQSLVLDRESKARRILDPIWQRLISAMRGREDQDTGSGGRKATPGTGNEAETVEGQLVLRFPLARRGYDPVAVDEYVADLERELAALDRELAKLRGQSAPAEELESEIKRIGEQTSAVLMAANEQREEILRTAKAEADRRVAEATATARTVTGQSEARLRDLATQNAAARGERDRLLADIRTISTALATVADSVEGSS